VLAAGISPGPLALMWARAAWPEQSGPLNDDPPVLHRSARDRPAALDRAYDPEAPAATLGPTFNLVGSRRHDHSIPGGNTQRFSPPSSAKMTGYEVARRLGVIGLAAHLLGGTVWALAVSASIGFPSPEV
jgi:hypothetical protein